MSYHITYSIELYYPFTGKERDEETGYGYFGARYMDHEVMTMWLSVDPMADKYPSISPYAYCAWNPVKLVDPDGRDWYQKGKDYYWNEKVVSRNTTPEGCRYIGGDNALYWHFGLTVTTTSQKTSQTVQTLVGTNAESRNPYEPKYYVYGTAKAKAESSIEYSTIKDERTGKLKRLIINASLNTAVSDNGAGGHAAAWLEVTCGGDHLSVPFEENNKGLASIGPKDIYTHKYLHTSVTIPANNLSEKCFSELQIRGPWFNDRPMTVPFTLGIVPSWLKHKYK